MKCHRQFHHHFLCCNFHRWNFIDEGIKWKVGSGIHVASHFLLQLMVLNEIEVRPRCFNPIAFLMPFDEIEQHRWGFISFSSSWFLMKLGFANFIVFLMVFNEIERYRFSQFGLPFHCFPKGFQWNWEYPIPLFS